MARQELLGNALLGKARIGAAGKVMHGQAWSGAVRHGYFQQQHIGKTNDRKDSRH